MDNMREFMAMVRAAKTIESLPESTEEQRKAAVGAEFDKDGVLSVKIEGRNDFLLVAISELYLDFAEQANLDPEDLYYLITAINVIKGDLEKKFADKGRA